MNTLNQFKMRSSGIFSAVLLALAACKQPVEQPKEIAWDQEKSTALNKSIALEEDLDIRMYLDSRKSWKTLKTGSGLRYCIYETGNGPKAESGLLAEVKFRISLLDGTLCYATDSLETETFEIDRSNVESGVQEGVKLLRVGDKAKLIVPSHLGHGLAGDMDKIPPLTPLVIDIQLISLRRK
jgi:FKBP-type peptidyl-prolyl cis-trans isomerase FkpA